MSVKRKVISITCVFLLLIIVATAAVLLINKSRINKNNQKNITVEVNAIEHQIDSGDIQGAKSNLHELSDTKSNDATALIISIAGISVVFVITIFGYVYVRILKPFERMHDFAANIAAGDLDTELHQERGQYFGEFTWAFDSMRNEIRKAHESEKNSIENNKTVIATLSHDIKTPISSIRSYSEALEANLDKTPEKRQKYLQTIINKCDEVSRLTDDLFIHSVSEMDRLSVNVTAIDIQQFFANSIDEINVGGNVNYKSNLSAKAMIKADPQRLLQICENIVGNANKYAPGSKVDITLLGESDSRVAITFRDYGPGIPEENLPFITQKFYRGNNVETVPGSGLGLYIVNYLTNKMGANLTINNVYDGEFSRGLLVKITFEQVS